jgi:hypothetical protein
MKNKETRIQLLKEHEKLKRGISSLLDKMDIENDILKKEELRIAIEGLLDDVKVVENLYKNLVTNE